MSERDPAVEAIVDEMDVCRCEYCDGLLHDDPRIRRAVELGRELGFELCALLMEAFPGPYDIDRAEAAAAIRARSEVKP